MKEKSKLYEKRIMTAAAGKKMLKRHSFSTEISFQSTHNKTKYINITFKKGGLSLQRNKVVRFRPHNLIYCK